MRAGWDGGTLERREPRVNLFNGNKTEELRLATQAEARFRGDCQASEMSQGPGVAFQKILLLGPAIKKIASEKHSETMYRMH